MKRTSSGRPSLALRVKNENEGTLKSSVGKSFGGIRSSVGGRLSLTGGKKVTGSGSLRRPTSSKFGASGSSSRSSVIGRIDTFKDPRRLTDKSFKDKCIRELIDFLQESKYPYPLSQKALQTPTTKDFVRIFEFLNRFVDHTYTVGSKLEDEVPRIMKQYGYPFTIPKSAMHTVGTQHTWPSLLGALTWLKQQIQHTQMTDIDDVLFPPSEDFEDVDGASQEKLLYDFCEKTYTDYMNGQDDFSKEEEMFAKSIILEENVEVDALEAENERLKRELRDLKAQPDILQEMSSRKSGLENDISKIKKYSRQLDETVDALQAKERELETLMSRTKLELESTLKENKRMQVIQDTQGYTQEYVEETNRERRDLERQIAGFESEIQNLDKDIGIKEMDIAKIQDQVEKKCGEYNRLCQMLKLVPKTAENAFGVDYEIRATSHGAETDHFTNVIKPALSEVKNQCKARVEQLQEIKFNEKDRLEHSEEVLQEKKEVVRKLEINVNTLETAIEESKETFKLEYEKLQRQEAELRQEISLAKKPGGMSMADAEKELYQMKKRFEKRQRERELEKQKYKTFIKNVVGLVIDHKTILQEETSKVLQEQQKRYQKANDQIELQ